MKSWPEVNRTAGTRLRRRLIAPDRLSGYKAVGVPARDERPMSVTSDKAQRRRRRRIHPAPGPRRHHRAGHPHLPVPAVQHPVRLDEGDAAGRRLPVRVEILLRLQPLFAAAVAADVLRPDRRLRQARARRHRGVPPAEGRQHRLHQARDRPARRLDPDDRRHAAHQRQAGASASASRISSTRTRAAARPGCGAGKRRCRTA